MLELMLIENDARRFVTQAIEIEKEMTSLEIWEKIKGKILVVNEEYIKLKEKMTEIIAQLNSVANSTGKGRDDLEYSILEQAEGILRTVTKE